MLQWRKYRQVALYDGCSVVVACPCGTEVISHVAEMERP